MKLGYTRLHEEGEEKEFEPLPADNYELVERLEDAILHGGGDIELCSTLWHNFWHPKGVLANLPGSKLSGAEADQELHCLWTLLFKPSPLLRVRLAAAKQRLFGDAPAPRYAAAHLRLGGLSGEEEKNVVESNEQQIKEVAAPFVVAHSAHLCVLELAKNITREGEATLPALLVTDNAALRRAARAGLMTGVVGPPHYAVHVSRGTPSEADLWTMWVELGLLAGAEYLLRSDSGFSNAAAWWGGARVMNISECVEKYGRMPAPEEEELSRKSI